MTYQPIENYGVIGDLHTVALVGMNGSIDFMSFPHFDSPTVFCAMLDHRKGGRFQIAPVLGEARQKQLYLPDSNILISRFLSDEGVAEVSDFMPIEGEGQAQAHNLVRRAKTVRTCLQALPLHVLRQRHITDRTVASRVWEKKTSAFEG